MSLAASVATSMSGSAQTSDPVSPRSKPSPTIVTRWPGAAASGTTFSETPAADVMSSGASRAGISRMMGSVASQSRSFDGRGAGGSGRWLMTQSLRSAMAIFRTTSSLIGCGAAGERRIDRAGNRASQRPTRDAMSATRLPGEPGPWLCGPASRRVCLFGSGGPAVGCADRDGGSAADLPTAPLRRRIVRPVVPVTLPCCAPTPCPESVREGNRSMVPAIPRGSPWGRSVVVLGCHARSGRYLSGPDRTDRSLGTD